MKLPVQAKVITILIFLSLIFTFLSGCNASSTSSNTELGMASMDAMPAKVKTAPAVVQQAYQFAVANPELMQHIPCYCGCGAIEHTSNYDCYISGVNQDGNYTFDSHALGCSICVDITQDAMRMHKQGRQIAEIKSFIDQAYSPYGPSNIP